MNDSRIKSRLFALFIFVLIWSVGLTSIVSANVEVRVSYKRGVVNWSQGYIEAKGMAVPPGTAETEAQGKLLARRGAIVDGQRRLLEIIEGVRVKGKTTMVNMMAQDVVRQSVEGFVKGAEIVSEKWHSEEKMYELKMRIGFPRLRTIVYDQQKEEFAPDQEPEECSYTGLIIDARGTSLTPQMVFQIIDRNGRLIYGQAQAFYQSAVDSGMVEYDGSLQEAKDSPRVGSNPMVVDAVGVGGEFNTKLVVSVSDGQKIKNNLAGTDVFLKTKVIVIMD